MDNNPKCCFAHYKILKYQLKLSPQIAKDYTKKFNLSLEAGLLVGKV